MGSCVRTVEAAKRLVRPFVDAEHDETFVYCYLRNMTIGTDTFTCPNFPFVIAKSVNFTIDGITYVNKILADGLSTNSLNQAFAPTDFNESEEEEYTTSAQARNDATIQLLVSMISAIAFTISAVIVIVIRLMRRKKTTDQVAMRVIDKLSSRRKAEEREDSSSI